MCSRLVSRRGWQNSKNLIAARFVFSKISTSTPTTMPEGPELHLSAKLVQQMGKRTTFGGPIIKSKVSTKNPDVEWVAEKYTLDAISRGKEMKVFLTDVSKKKKKDQEPTISILMRFGMSGNFKITSVEDLPKHAHLQFYTSDKKEVLSFVDYRRFGRWFINDDWDRDRGPCFITEYALFREHVTNCLNKVAFEGPVCEVFLDQKYFNGVGNYLRAEALHRCGIRPFDSAREVLTPLLIKKEEPDEKPAGRKVKVKEEERKAEDDVLFMLNKLAHEVVAIGQQSGYFYDAATKEEKTSSTFFEWLQCYNQEGMKFEKDRHNRMVWYTGEPGTCPKVEEWREREAEKETRVKVKKGSPLKVKKEPNGKVKKEPKVKVKKEEPEEVDEKPAPKRRKKVATKDGVEGQKEASGRTTRKRKGQRVNYEEVSDQSENDERAVTEKPTRRSKNGQNGGKKAASTVKRGPKAKPIPKEEKDDGALDVLPPKRPRRGRT